MKQATKRKIVAAAAVPVMAVAGAVGLPLVLGSCDNSKSTVPQPTPPVPITNLFGINGLNATVKGNFVSTELADIADEVKNALNNRFRYLTTAAQNMYKDVLGRGITIIIDENLEHPNFQTTHNGNVIHINFGILGDERALQMAIENAMLAIYSDLMPEVGRARDGYQKKVTLGVSHHNFMSINNPLRQRPLG